MKSIPLAKAVISQVNSGHRAVNHEIGGRIVVIQLAADRPPEVLQADHFGRLLRVHVADYGTSPPRFHLARFEVPGIHTCDRAGLEYKAGDFALQQDLATIAAHGFNQRVNNVFKMLCRVIRTPLITGEQHHPGIKRQFFRRQ